MKGGGGGRRGGGNDECSTYSTVNIHRLKGVEHGDMNPITPLPEPTLPLRPASHIFTTG